jgi:CRISPR/Cas system-associated protein Cas5 (RAMP superfamily)
MEVLKYHEGLRKAESLLAIKLRMGTNGLDAFLFQAKSPLCLPPSATVIENGMLQRASLSYVPSTLGHSMT